MLNIDSVDVKYGGVQALHGVSLNVAPGEFVAIVGANGAGKTTMLKTISGIVRPSAGSVTFEGKNLKSVQPESIVKLGIAQVPEGRRIFTTLTVLENLKMGAYTCTSRMAENLEKMFARFPRLSERRNQSGKTLSGGEQQMLAIARAVMSSPKLLLMDEPSMGLAPQMVQEVFNIASSLNNEGVAILMVEQNSRMALKYANRAYVLENGRVVMSGEASKLRDDPEVQKRYLGYAE